MQKPAQLKRYDGFRCKYFLRHPPSSGGQLSCVNAYMEIVVPVSPATPAPAFSSSVISARRPGRDSANFTAACTLGSIDPGANWPSAIYRSASAGVRESSHFTSGLPKLMATFSTAVRIIRVSASSCSASFSLAKSQGGTMLDGEELRAYAYLLVSLPFPIKLPGLNIGINLMMT